MWLENSDKLAEMCGIILGDGGMYQRMLKGKKHSQLTVTLNGVDEKDYVDYVKNLMISLFGNCCTYKLKGNKAVRLYINKWNVVSMLKNRGIKCGNKVENQVGVPLWIKVNEEFTKSCLKGLIDTDGSVYYKKTFDKIGIFFTNHSRKLLDDFYEMCELIGVKANTPSNRRVYISGKKDVEIFLETVKPFRWNRMINQNPKIIEKLQYKIRSYTNDDVIKKGKERGFEVLSCEYVNLDSNCKLKCNEGHIWLVRAETVIRGTVCPICNRIQEGNRQRKLNISREELEKLVWEIPSNKIAKMYNVSGRLITKRCQQLDIDKPSRGYWAKVKSKKNNANVM